MGINGWLILCLGAFGAVCGSKCVPATAICSRYWVKIEPHRNLMESEEELKSWCRKQSLFFKCLEDVLLEIYGNYSKLPTDLLVSKMFTEDLCLEGSTSRQRYLDNAACINRLNMDYCTLPEYLEIVTPGDSIPSKCSSMERTFSCIAATMVIKCGFDAGRVYRYLLKVTKYGGEICGVESSDTVACDEAPDSDEGDLSEIYYGLVHRFGSIPEQTTADGIIGETMSVSESYDFISRSLKKALDAIDYSKDNVESEMLTSGDGGKRSKEESRKRPVIIEQFKGLLFYNYTDQEFEFYWRQPGSFPIVRVTCEHVLPPHMTGVTLECTVHYRAKEPECHYNTMPTTNERVTPELIRDIDTSIPEDSKLDISERLYLNDFIKAYQKYRMYWDYWIPARLVVRMEEMLELTRDLVRVFPNNKVCAKELRFYDIINDQDIPWWQCPSLFSDELRNEIVTFLYGNRTIDDTLFLSVFNEDDKSYVHLFEPLLHGFDKVVCERVNECHPRGRGVFKCSLKRRDLKGCDYCCNYQKPVKCVPSHREDSESESVFETSRLSEEGSGAPEDSSVILVDEATLQSEELTNSITEIIDENEELVAFDSSEFQSESSSESSSDINLVLLSQGSGESDENAFSVRSGIWSTSDNETPCDDLYEHDLELMDQNIFVFQPVPSVANIEAAYVIDLEH